MLKTMHDNLLLATEVDILVLLAIACLAAIALKHFHFPYTVGLAIVGIMLGWLGQNIETFGALDNLSLSHDLILFVFVPPLIFESALNLDSRLLLRSLIPILALAVPGFLVSTAIVGSILSLGAPLTLSQALLFGSLISATDPVAVIALFKELGAPQKLTILLEGESLFNDATAIVTFNIILEVIASGELSATKVGQGVLEFVVSFLCGILVGAVWGYVARFPMAWAKDNALVLATISGVLAYGALLSAEEVFEVSGIIAVMSAGIVAGWYKTNSLEVEVRQFLGEFWEYAAFLADSLIFLLVGLTVSRFEFLAQLEQTQSLFLSFGLATGAILVARAAVVFAIAALVNRFQAQPIDLPYQVISFWGGLRGAVCLALALSLEPDFPNRDLVLFLTLGVALFTLLVPGTTVGSLLKSFNLDRPASIDRIRRAANDIAAKRKALVESQALLTDSEVFPSNILAEFERQCQEGVAQSEQVLGALTTRMTPEELPQLIWLEALSIEQTVYRSLHDRGFISPAGFDYFSLRVNLNQDLVLAGTIPPKVPVITPLEQRWQRFWLTIGEKIAVESLWFVQLKSRLVLDEYKYWIVRAYAAKQVPVLLSEFSAAGHIEGPSLTQCMANYASIRTKALQKAESLAREYPDLVSACQLQLAMRVASLVEGEALVERLPQPLEQNNPQH